MAPPRSFPIRYARASRWLMAPLLLGARHAKVELSEDDLRVRMGWAFRATIPRRSIRRAALHREVVWAVGVHSDLRFKSWLVNGAMKGVVFLDILPPARGRFAVFPITVERLGLGLEDPDAFLRSLGLGAGTSGES